MAIHTTLNDLFTEIADAIRAKKKSTEAIIADNFPTEIENLRTGFDYNNQNVTTLPDYVFYGCEDLNSVDCCNLTSVGDSVFENCENLKTVVLYDCVESIGDHAFSGCTGLTDVYYDGTVSQWAGISIGSGNEALTDTTIHFASVIVADGTCGYNLTWILDNEGTLAIFGTGKMEDYIFTTAVPWQLKISSVKKVVIGNSVTSIGNYAFTDCTSLTSVIIPDSVTSIGKYAFEECSGLTSITIPDGVTSIGNRAFTDCTGLTSITIGNSVTSINGSAFNGCESLTSVNITDIAAWCKILFSEWYSNPLVYAKNLYLNGEPVTDVVIPDSMTSIGKFVFLHCTSLTSITIPDGVTSIGACAFNGCTSLNSIAYDGTITKWNAISKGEGWNSGVPATHVQCSDGQVSLV